MERVTRLSKKIVLSYKTLPEKKKYLDLLAVLVSIPMCATILILNLNTLKTKNVKTNTTPETNKSVEKIIVTVPVLQSRSREAAVVTSPSPSQGPCDQNIGPVSIDSPDEGDTVSDNPVSIDVNYKQGDYCAVVWSYRINGGPWSDYDDKSIALYNPPSGNVKFDLRVKSVVTGEEKTVTRKFTYAGPTIAPSLDSQTASSSGK